MKKLHLLLIPLFLCFVSFAHAISSETSKKILDYIFENLSEAGTLRQDERGFVYVDIDDEYIYKLNALIKDEGYEMPPYFGWKGAHGAHISVIYAKEAKNYKVKEIKEVGSTIYFKPKSCSAVEPGSWDDVEEVFVITVEAPILDKLRKKYGLPKAHYDFHITIGLKYRQPTAA